MNKKFSTLLAGAAFLSAVSVNSVYAQGVQDNSLPTEASAYPIVKLAEGTNTGLFQLKIKDSDKVLSMDKDGKLTLVNVTTSSQLANTLWCVTVTSENQGQTHKYDFMNKGTGMMLDITMSDIVGAEESTPVIPTTGGEISGWAFSREINKLEPERPLFSHFSADSIVGFSVKTNDDKVYVQKEGAKKAETAGFAKFTLQAPGQIYLSAEELNTIFGVQKEDAGVKLTFNKDVLGTTLTNPFNANKFLAEESGDTKYLYISDLKKEAYLRVDTAYTNESGTKFLAYNWTKKGKTGEAIDAVRGSKIQDQHKFAFLYSPAYDSLYIYVHSITWNETKANWETLVKKPEATGDNWRVSLQDLIKNQTRILTVDAKEQNTHISFGNMDSAEVGKYIESVAVRIGFHNGGSLAGTGVLYTLQAQKRAVVLTAGHVLQNDSHICPAVLSVWSKSGTKNISLDLSDSDDNKEVNIHYCPGFMYNGRKYVFDAAIIDVPWHDWMVNIPEIRLGEAKISTQIQLIGFPKSTDGEATQEDWTKGRMGLRAELPTSADNDEEKAFKFSYHSDNSYPIERDDIMKGYSGSGLFLCDSEYPQLIGLVSQSYGSEDAGNVAWAVSSYALKLLLSKYDLVLKESEFENGLSTLTEGYPERPGIFLQDAVEKLHLSEEQLHKTHQEQLFPDDFPCDMGKRCAKYWKGRAITAVYIWLINGKCPNTWENVKIEIQTSTGEKIPVNLEFLCADEKNEIAGVLRTLIKKGGFSENHFQNQTLFFLNSKDSLPGTREISRKRCSNVIKNIVQQDYKRERERQNMFHVTKGDPGEVSMAIISLDSFRTLLEELSYDMVDECLTDEMVKPVIQRKLKELWE